MGPDHQGGRAARRLAEARVLVGCERGPKARVPTRAAGTQEGSVLGLLAPTPYPLFCPSGLFFFLRALLP